MTRWSPPEKYMLRRLKRGVTADLGLRPISTWDARAAYGATVSAELVEYVVGRLVSGRWARPGGLTILGAHIVGQLDFNHRKIDLPIRFRACSVPDGITARHARITNFSITDSIVGSSLGECVDLWNCELAGDLILSGEFRSNEGPCIQLSGAFVKGQLAIGNTDITSRSGPGISCERMQVGGDLFCREKLVVDVASDVGAVRLNSATIGGQLNMSGAKISNTRGPAIVGDSLKVGTAAFLHDIELIGHGEASSLRLVDATLGGLSISGARVENSSGAGIIADRLALRSNLRLTGNSSIMSHGEVPTLCLNGAQIGGQLELSDCTVSNSAGPTFSAVDAHVGGAAFFVDLALHGYGASATINISNSTFAKTLTLSGQVENNAGPSVRATGASVEGRLFVLPDTTVVGHDSDGTINLIDARIGGLGMRHVYVRNRLGSSILADRMQIRTNVDLYSMVAIGSGSGGTLSLAGADIGGQLILSQASVKNLSGPAIEADNLTARGTVFFEGASLVGHSVLPAVSMIGAITQDVRLAGASLTNDIGPAVTLQQATVSMLDMTGIGGTGLIDLSGSVIRHLKAMDEELAQRTVQLEGWVVTRLSGVLDSRRRRAEGWLMSGAVLTRGRRIPTQPWHGLADAYEGAGRPEDARWIRYRSARAATRAIPRRRWATRSARLLYEGVAGYGYYPFRAIIWLLAVLVVAGFTVNSSKSNFTAVASVPAREGAPARIDRVRGDLDCDQVRRSYPSLVCLQPWSYAFENVLPSAQGAQAATWRPDTTPGGMGSATNWIAPFLGFCRSASWVFGAMFLAGVTGLLRKA